jgi:rhodanese-related sulfurtransferase
VCRLQPSEVERGAIKDAVNMPLSSLREKLVELPNDKKLYVYCQVSRVPCAGMMHMMLHDKHGM